MSERETNTRISRSQHGHRSRKHANNPSTEREQKKTSRIQTLGLGAGESIKEKQVSFINKLLNFLTLFPASCYKYNRNCFYVLAIYRKLK